MTQKEINKAQILSLASMDFIRSRQNIIINGKTGTGKSNLAKHLVLKLFKMVLQFIILEHQLLLEDIKLSRIDGNYTNLVKRFARYKLYS